MSPNAIQNGDPRGMTLFALTFGALFAAPLMADPIARLAGFYVFLVADPRIQLVWASGVLLFGGLPVYFGVWQSLRAGRVGLDLVVLAVLLAGYGYGAFAGLRNDPVSTFVLQATSGVLLFSLLLRLQREGRPR